MINLHKCKHVVSALVMLVLFWGAMSLGAQSPTSASDAEQIAGLMAGLSDHTIKPADVLDPNLAPSERDRNLRRFSEPNYELSLVPTEGVPAITGDSVSIPVRVHFDGRDGNTLDAGATAQFVKRNGKWYFSSFDFMSWPVFLIVVLVVGLLVGICYAATVLVLGSKLLRQGPLGVNAVKMFFPFFWPSLFRRVGRRPD